MAFGFLGVGSAVPERVLTNKELEEMVETNDEWIRARTGICERRIADDQTASSDLGAQAARKAMEDAGVGPEDIDLIVVGTYTPDNFIPSTACHVMAKLDIPDCPAFDVNAACTSFIYALQSAHGLMKNGLAKRALVIGSDCVTKFIDFEDRGTCILFGDGAGAVVLGEVEDGAGILGESMSANGRMAEAIIVPGLGSRMPATKEVLENRDQYMKMSGNEVFKFAVRILADALTQAADRAGVAMDEIDWVIPHQANVRIIDGAIKRTHIPRERFVLNMDRYGNTSAGSVPLALDEAIRDGRIQRGQLLGLVAFGGGLTWAGSVVRY